MPDKCVNDPERDCPVSKRTEDVAGEVKALGRELSDLRQSVSGTNERFGARIGKLESRNDVQDEQRMQMKAQILEIKEDVAEFRREQKDSISELRREHKESMEELKRGNKEILDTFAPIRHKIEDVEKLERDVDELKKKPGDTWEHIKKQGLGWAVALLLALLAAALGLSQFV